MEGKDVCEFIIHNEKYIKCNRCGALIYCTEDMSLPTSCPICNRECNGIQEYDYVNMKVSDFIEYAKKNNILDYIINIQYRDSGGEYSGCDNELYLQIDSQNKILVL